MFNGTIPAPTQLDVRGADEACAPAETAMETAQSRDSGGLGSTKKKRPKGPGGRRKSLKRLDPDKEIKAFPLVFLGRALVDLARFG
jgi:hypothetical protein